ESVFRRVADVHVVEVELFLAVFEFGQRPFASRVVASQRGFLTCGTPFDDFATKRDVDPSAGVVLHGVARGFTSDDLRRVEVVVEVPATRRAIGDAVYASELRCGTTFTRALNLDQLRRERLAIDGRGDLPLAD